MKMGFMERGGCWVAVQMLLMGGVVGASLVWRSSDPCRICLVVGTLFAGVGAFFGISGVMALGGELTPFPKPRPDARLVCHGIYAWVRHPLYTSVFFACLGWSMLWQSWIALGVSLLLGAFLIAKARREERWLKKQFKEYDDYARRTSRFIPGLYWF